MLLTRWQSQRREVAIKIDRKNVLLLFALPQSATSSLDRNTAHQTS